MTSTRMRPSIDVKQYRRLPSIVRERFDDWLREESLMGEYIFRLVLGEGGVIADRYRTTEGGRIVDRTERVIFPIRSMPPREAFEVQEGEPS